MLTLRGNMETNLLPGLKDLPPDYFIKRDKVVLDVRTKQRHIEDNPNMSLLDIVYMEVIQQALDQHQGVQAHAARFLGMRRSTMHDYVRRWNLHAQRGKGRRGPR